MGSLSGNTEPHDGEIRLWREEGWWIAKDIDSGVTTQGKTRETVLANLDDAVQLYNGESGQPPTDAELEAMGIEPTAKETGDREPPDLLK